ncbi:MAG: winged helix-turn-helix domain-containing protein [Candidatus Omnitrophica bacterium]|nr:winged helix-turn-helix domain-containing protein [Candidatus Omnitrophota bacterium]
MPEYRKNNMITEIGIVAGEIWHFLDRNGEVNIDVLFAGIERRQEVVLMSLGWLAREGHVVLWYIDGKYQVGLRKPGDEY